MTHLLFQQKFPAFFKQWYSQGAFKFMTMYNQIIDANLDPLEDLACEYAWRNSPSKVATALMAPGVGMTSSSSFSGVGAPVVEEVVTTPPKPDKTRRRSQSLDEPHFISC
jgi:hypothetical protein